MSNENLRPYKHGEAFSWMYYSSQDGSIGYWIYNSRDGVTPFICHKDGIELTHRNWNKDLQVPNYKPVTGDLVWKTISPEEAETFIRDRIKQYPEMLYGEDIEEVVKKFVEESIEKGEPTLAVVDTSGNYVKCTAVSEKQKLQDIADINEAIKKVDSNLISDGYHTFGELYEHRIQNFIALCRQLDFICTDRGFESDVWKSKAHSDGSIWDGWFILGIYKKSGWQITYHLPIEKWDECKFATTLDKAPEYDGHTSQDVLERLKMVI